MSYQRLQDDLHATMVGEPRPVPGPDGVPLRIFGNPLIWHSEREDVFGIVDKHGDTHWVEVNFG